MGVKVVALANRRKSIAWRLQEFFRYPPKSVQYVQLLTVRPHLYMNAAAPLYDLSRGFVVVSEQGAVADASDGEINGLSSAPSVAGSVGAAASPLSPES